MFVKSSVAMALMATFVVAQNTTFDPSSIDPTTRAQWCQGQENTCGTLCSGSIETNNCDSTSLNYTCLCAANDSTPGLQYYITTMPTFICEVEFKDCIADNAGDAAAQAVCNSNEKANCGHLDPANFTAAAATTSSAATTATSSSATASGTAASTTSSKAGAPTLAAMQNFGTGAVAVGVAAAFGYML